MKYIVIGGYVPMSPTPEQRAKDAKYERLKERCIRAVERLDPNPRESSDAVWFKAEIVCERWLMVMDIRNGLLRGNHEVD